MNPFQRVFRSIKMSGVGGSIAKLAGPYCDRKFDRDYGVETCAIRNPDTLTIQSENREQGYRYQATRVLPLRKMLSHLRRQLPAGSVLVDFGCGKGRVLLLAAEQGFAARGVEYSSELCEIARRNVAAFKSKTGSKMEMSVIEGDVTTYEVRPDEAVFFLFNPFEPPIFERAVANLAASLERQPRELRLVLYLPNEQYHEAILARPQFQLASRHRFRGYQFAVYSARC